MALANLVLPDGQTTPANHTFTWNTEVPLASWSEKASGIAIGEPRVSLAQSRPNSNRHSQKTVMKVEVPVLETISGDVGGYTPAPRVAYTLLAECHFVCPDRSTLANRKDLYAFFTNLLGLAMVKATVVDQLPAA